MSPKSPCIPSEGPPGKTVELEKALDFLRYRQVCAYTVHCTERAAQAISMVIQLQHFCSEQQSNWGLNLAAAACATPRFQFASQQPSITGRPADIRVVYLYSMCVQTFMHFSILPQSILRPCADHTHGELTFYLFILMPFNVVNALCVLGGDGSQPEADTFDLPHNLRSNPHLDTEILLSKLTCL